MNYRSYQITLPLTHTNRVVGSADWVFPTRASTWRWVGECVTLDTTFHNPRNKQLTKVSKWEPDEHPLLHTTVVAVLCNNNWIFSAHTVFLLFSEWTVTASWQTPANGTPQRSENFEVNGKCLLLLNELPHFLDSKTQFSILKNFQTRGSSYCSSVLILLASCQQTCVTYTIAVCTLKNSWWRTEELSETCRVLFQK